MASLLAARRQHPAAALRLHANAKAVRLGASASARLKGALWKTYPPSWTATGGQSLHPQRQNSPLPSSAADSEFLSVFDPCAQGQESGTGLAACTRSSAALRSLVFVIRRQVSLYVLPEQVVRRGEPDLGRRPAANADLLRLPHPVLEFGNQYRRDINRRNCATQRRIGRRPGLGATLHHLLQNIVRRLPVAPFDALHPDLVCQLHGRAHAPERGHVRAADALKALRAQLRFIPPAGDDAVPHPVTHLCSLLD